MSVFVIAEFACWLRVESDALFGWPHLLPNVRHKILKTPERLVQAIVTYTSIPIVFKLVIIKFK